MQRLGPYSTGNDTPPHAIKQTAAVRKTCSLRVYLGLKLCLGLFGAGKDQTDLVYVCLCDRMDCLD